MPDIDSLKIELLDKLWLPKAKEARSLIYPKRRNNARMSLFTLTDGISLREILKLEEENLIQKENVVAWVRTMNKRWRVEAESVGCVLHGDVYDGPFLGPSCEVATRIPFDIINLDFESQQPTSKQGRIENEIEKLAKIISLQGQKGCNKFVLIYTTFVDIYDINAKGIVEEFGLNLNGFANTVTDAAHKQSFLRVLFEKLIQKNAYKCASDVVCLSYGVPGSSVWLLSMVSIVTR